MEGVNVLFYDTLIGSTRVKVRDPKGQVDGAVEGRAKGVAKGGGASVVNWDEVGKPAEERGGLQRENRR